MTPAWWLSRRTGFHESTSNEVLNRLNGGGHVTNPPKEVIEGWAKLEISLSLERPVADQMLPHFAFGVVSPGQE